MALQNKKIAFIGGGQITEIIVAILRRTGKVFTGDLTVSDKDKNKLKRLHKKYGIVEAYDNLNAFSRGDFIFINVPPKAVGEVLKELSRQYFQKIK